MTGRVSLGLLTSRYTGSHVLGVLAALRDDVTVRWVLGSDVTAAETLANQHGLMSSQVGKLREWDNVCKDKSVDGVLVCSPDASVNMVRRALSSGKSVFCDRPVSLQPSALVACYEEADAHRAHLLFGFLRRFDPVLADVKEQLGSGVVGEVRSVRSLVSYSPDTDTDSSPESGGLFRDIVSDEVNTVCWLLGTSPRSVYASVVPPGSAKTLLSEECTSASVVLKFDQVIATLDVNPSDKSNSEENRLEIHGSKGILSLVSSPTNGSSSISTRVGDDAWHTHSGPGLRDRNSLALSKSLHYFLRAIRGEVNTAEEDANCLNSICVTAACQHAMHGKQTVTMTTPDTELPEVKLKRPLWKERPAAWF